MPAAGPAAVNNRSQAGRSWQDAVRLAGAQQERPTRRRAESAQRRVRGETPATAVDLLGPPEGNRRVITPIRGEGAPEDDWDELTPEQRVDRALAGYEAALDKARAARTTGERDRWREAALGELSAVRADMVALDGGLDRYARLQEEIDD